MTKDYSNVTGKVEILTPEQAEKDLAVMAAASFNRKHSQSRVDYYARIMTDGDWMMTGQPGIFDDDGILVDGQHRWLACVKSGIEIPVFVVRGVEHRVFPALDDVKARRLHDLLSCAYKTNGGVKLPPHPQPAALAKVIAFAHEIAVLQGVKVLPRSKELPHPPWTAGEYQRWYADEHPGIADAHAYIATYRGIRGGATAPLAAVYYWLAKLDLEAARNFVSGYAKGEIKGEDGTTQKLFHDHPIMLLRDKFVEASRRGSLVKIGGRQKIASLIMLWNHLITGTSPKGLRQWVWGAGITDAIVFPKIEEGGLLDAQ